MLARLQQCVVLILFTAIVTWAGTLLWLGYPLTAGWGALTIFAGYAGFLAAEFSMLRWIDDAAPAPPPSALQLVRAWAHEVMGTPRVFMWRQPFRADAEPDNLSSARAGQRGVVFVHGFVCNRAFWNPWLRELRIRQHPFIAVNLEPLFGSIDDYRQIIEAAVARMQAATGLPVVIVGHSMGGIAIRAWLESVDADARVHRVITIGSPHHGTWLARYGRVTNGAQMRLGSLWLANLARREPAGTHARFTCFFGHCDNIVFPARSATLPGAHNVHVPGTAHVQMAFQAVVFREVWRWLCADGDLPASPRLGTTLAQ